MTARVLVVDDVPANVELMRAKLESRFFLVDAANDGPEALAIARDSQPDVILLDVMMPGMDGFEVCRALKGDQATSHIPVVMVTALGEREYRVRGLEAGADDFLTKPTNDLTLIARVKSLSRLRTMTDEWRARLSTVSELGITVPASEVDVPDRPGTIVVVEPDALEAGNARKALEGEGHKVIESECLTDGDGDVETHGADAFIIGLASDPTVGFRMLSTVRAAESTRQLPVLAVIPDGADDQLAEALDLGANDCVVKPIEEVELCARVRTQLRRWRYRQMLSQQYGEGLRLALQDELTGLYNRRYLTHHLQRLLTDAGARGKTVSAVMIDIDHFKQINDANGHGFGDVVLRAIADRIADRLRPSDTLARLGGEEFVAVMPESSSDEAEEVAERLRMTVAQAPFDLAQADSPINVTISCGVATAEPGTVDTDGLLRLADKALYRAKQNGRNQVVAAVNL